MEALALVTLVIFSLVGFAAIFFTTFGTLIIFAGTCLYAFLTNFNILGLETIILLFVLYLLGEALEYLFVIIGAKRLGASNKAVIGALVGGIIGAILGVGFLGVGILLGTFLGIFLGAFLVELTIHKDFVKSLKAGVGGVLGRFGFIIAKVIIAAVMLGVVVSKVV